MARSGRHHDAHVELPIDRFAFDRELRHARSVAIHTEGGRENEPRRKAGAEKRGERHQASAPTRRRRFKPGWSDIVEAYVAWHGYRLLHQVEG
jgi:hypothetical protein